MAGELIYFAWVAGGTPWSAALERYDERIIGLELSQTEGEAASLRLEITNPGEGILSPEREQWAWLAWNDTGSSPDVYPMFYGRVVGLPDDLSGETVTIELLAKPSDYTAQKAALADTLRVLPFVDPLFTQDDADDPDAALGARAALYDVDRVTHAVTISDHLSGEDGTVDFDESEHARDGLRVNPGPAPLRRVRGTITIGYQQRGDGVVDLSHDLVTAFKAAGSPYEHPLIATFTGDGLLSDWPEPLTDMGGGWSTAVDATAELATWVPLYTYSKRYVDLAGFYFGLNEPRGSGNPWGLFVTPLVHWNAAFPVTPIKAPFTFAYSADRKRSEIATFVLAADVQDVVSDAAGADEEVLELSSDLVAEPVDGGGSPGTGTLPIGDPRRNTYLATDRGQQTIQYALLRAASMLIFGSRTATVTFAPLGWSKVWDISCRKSVLVHDPRLPGGQAVGKVMSYRLSLSGATGRMDAEIVAGCCVGRGNVLAAPVENDDTWAEDWADDWTEHEPGELVEIVAGQLQYGSLDGSIVLDDDGVDLLNMVSTRVLQSLTVTNGPGAQMEAIDVAAARANQPDPIGALREMPTTIAIALDPVTGGPFLSEFAITVLDLQLPQGIDLEALSGSP